MFKLFYFYILIYTNENNIYMQMKIIYHLYFN